MILNTNLKSIRVVLGEAITTNDCDVTASWGDYAGTQFVPGSADTVTNGTTPVTIVGAPGISEQRLVQEITVFNADTVPHTVILQLDNNSTIRVFRHQEIPVGGMLIYSPSAIGDVVNAPPAVLLETGTIGEKISNLPAFDVTLPATGAELVPIVEAGATTAITLAYLYEYSVQWLDHVATNPLDAPNPGSATVGREVYLQAGAGAGAGDAGGAFVYGGVGGATSGLGGEVQLLGGDGGGTGSGGFIDIRAGASGTGATGDGGAVTVTAGSSVATDGDGGAITVTAGTGTGSGAGGDINLTSGAAASTSGGINVATGVSSGSGSGFVEIFSGDAFDYSGGIDLFSGASAGNGGTTGDVQLQSGDNTDGPSGVVGLQTGQANSANAGRINLFSGAVASGDGNGGDIYLFPGAGHGTGRQGLVIAFNWPTADPLVSGGLWVDPVTHIVKMSP